MELGLKNNRRFINYSVPNDYFQNLLDRYHDYDTNWSVWRHFHRRRLEKIRSLLAQYVTKNHIGFALDLGCGKCPVLLLLEKFGFQEIWGVDCSEADIKIAKQLIIKAGLKNVKLFHKTVENIIVDDNYFDVIICTEVLEHLSNPPLGIKILERKLKPRGIAIISMPNLLSGHYFFGLLSFVVKYKLLKMQSYPSEYEKHLKYTYFSVCKMIKKYSDLIIIDKRSCYLYPFPSRLIQFLATKFPKFVEYFDRLEDSFLNKSLPYFGGSLFLVVKKG